jgi:hypothetical protein
MPFPNEHAARLTDPKKYDSFARKNDQGGAGVDFVFGVKEGKTELQAIRFDSKKFTAAEARAWCDKHGKKPILFEPASEKVVKLAVVENAEGERALAYALDGALPPRDGNLSIVGLLKSSLFHPGDRVWVRAKAAYPTKVDGKFGIDLDEIEVIEKADGRPSTAREIYQASQEMGILQLDESIQTELEEIHFVKRFVDLPEVRVDFNREIPLIKADAARHLVYGVVYAPFNGKNIDAHGDYMTAEEIEKACHQYLEDFNHISLMHELRIDQEARCVESFIAPCDYETDEEKVSKGSWVMVTHIRKQELWDAIESGEINAYSIEGTGSPGPDLVEADLKKSEGGQMEFTKRNLINCVINAVALVDKGANKRKFYLKKRNKPMTLEMAKNIVKGTQDAKLWDSIAKEVDEADRPEIEAAIAERKKALKPAKKATPAASNAGDIEERIKRLEAALDDKSDDPDAEDAGDDDSAASGDESDDAESETSGKFPQEVKDICEQLEQMASRLEAMAGGEMSDEEAQKALEFETNKPGGEYGSNELKNPPQTNKPNIRARKRIAKLRKAIAAMRKAWNVPDPADDADQNAGADEKDIKKYLDNTELEIPKHLIPVVKAEIAKIERETEKGN